MANNSIIAPNEFLPDENDKMFSSQRVQEQVFRLNQLAKLGGGEDWEGYQKKEEETGIPAIYHAFSKERRNVNEVHVPPGAVNEDNAELLESMPPADAAQIGFDKVTLDALAEYGRRRKFYGQMLDAQVEQMSAGEQWQSFGSGKFATAGMDAPEDITPENYGDNLSKMARAIREADGVDEVEARLRAERLMQVAGHKRTPEEQTYLDGAYARIQNGESIDTILAEDAFNKSPYLARMLQLYDNTLRRTAMMTQAVIGEVYGGEQWEKFSDKEKGYALDALRQSFPGLPWLHDVSPAMIGEKTLAGGGLQWENLANIMGAVTIGKAIIESFNPFSDGNPLYMGGGALKTNRYYYNRMIDAARPSSLAFDIGQGAIDSLAFLVNIGFGGFAAGTEKLLETITWRTALPTLGKVFGINALHALKGGKYGAYAINALVQGIGENMTAAEANPVVVYDGSTGMKVELNDGDADSMFNNIVLAFGRNYLAQAISVGTEGVGGVIDGLVTLPKGAKKFLLQKILGNLSPKVMARTQDMLGRFGINGMTGEFFEELLEDYLQPAKDRMLELVGADALSTHQTPQSWASPGRWALTTAGVLYAMRAPFSAVSTATVISDYARGKIAFEQVLNEAGVGEGSKPTDKDQSAVSGHAQRAMHVVNGRVHFVPSVGVEAVYAKHPDVAEKIRPIMHDDGTGTMAVNSFEAGEMMRNNPETVNAMREVLECTTSVKNLSVEDARAAIQVYGDRVQFVSDVAGAVKLGIEAMPDSSRRRRISGGNSYAIAQMVACFADVLLGRDFELLPPDAKAARKEEVIKAISGLTASDADALSSAVPVEERKGFNIGEAYDNLVALRNATADFADATGIDVSTSVMNAAEAAVALQDATEDTADLDVKLNDAVAAMLMAGLNGRPMMRVGNMALRVREVKGEADNSPATFRAEIQFLKPDTAKADRRRTPDANGVLVLGEADTYDKAVAIISTDAELRDDIRTRLAEATEATKAWRNAVNAGLYTALHGDAAMLANGDNITIRNEGGEINLRATAPLYRNLLKAVIMQQAGKTAEEVYTETMWIGDGNGNWTMALPRFELSDEAVNKFANGTPVTLGEIVGKNYPLFRIHPEMAALTVPVLDGDAADTVSGVPPRDAAAAREHAAGALRGDAKSRGMLAAMVYASVADVLERREGLQDGAIPRMMPNDDAITGEHLRDIVLRDGANGIFNQQEIDRRLIRSFAIPQEHQGNPAEYVLRLANGAGGIDALLEKGIETNASPPELQGLTTFSEKGGLVNDYSTLITLLKGADASTMPHELGHWMLRVLRQFVKSGVASRQLMDAVAAIDAHLDNYARSKGAIEGTNEWESVRHEAFSESFVKYLMTADADELTQGAFSQLRRQLLNTYKWMRSNSTIEPAASLNELFDSLVAAGEMFDRGEAPLSAFDADTFRAIFAEAGLLDSSNEAIGKFLDLLGIARDAQETLAGREAVNSIDREKLTAEARQKYADSSFAKLAAALNRLGGFPVEALIEALPDTVPGEKREELRRVLHETARRQGWVFHARTAEALMREARRGEEDAKAAVKAQTTRIAEMEQQLAALENHAREVAGRPAAIRQEIDSIMADVNAIAKKIEDLQSRHFPDAQRLTELQSQLDINKKRHKPTAKLREEIDTLQKRMARFVRKREELNYAQRRLNDKAMKASGRLERVNASNAVAEAQADVAQKKADIEIARGRLAELQDALQIARENANAARAHTGMRDVTYSITAYHGSPADLAQMRKRAEAFAARYPGVVFHIVDHFDQLSETLRERPQSRYMEGCVDENGEVWIVLGMVTPERIDAVCAHETVGHVGLENFIGAGFLGFLDDVYRQHVSDMDEIRRRYGIDDAHGGVAEQRRLTREWLAHLAESLPEDRPGFWAQIVAAFRELLRSLGFDMEWSERDLRVLLAKDAVYLRNATAADITAQYGESARPYPDGGALHSISPNSDFSSQAAEDLRSLEISDQMRALRAAMDSGELPARSFAELVDAIASFRTEADFVKEYKAAAMRDAFNHPDMTMRMKTLDSAKLNAMFEQLALVLKQFAPNYTYSQRRQINVSRALQLIGGSTVNAIMHNRLDAEGLDGDVRLFGSIKAEANNIVMALSKIAKRAGELRKDGEPTTESLKVKARDAQLALESLNRINQFVAVARRINRAQAMVTNFVKELRVSSLGKQRGRIDGDALNALREILLAVTHNQNVPIDANSQRNSVGNWRKRYVSEMDAAAVESGMEPRQWGEVCFRDDIDLQSLTIDEAQELSEFFKFIKHTGRALVDQTRLDNKEHRRSTIRQIVAELTPDAERNNHHAMPATEERDAGLWELLKSVCRSWDARSTSVWRYMTEHGEALNGIYRLLTEMKTREDSLRALVYDGNGADGLNTILQDIERIASEQGVDVSSLDNSPVAFTGNDDTHSYRHWTLHEVIMATLYLGTDSGRQRLRRTINTDSAMREADLVEKYPDAVLEQIPAALPPVILEKVNGIWAALERLNASVRDTYRKQYGYELDLLDPVPFSVNGVQMTGGYAPIAYRYSAAAYKPGLQDKVGEGKGTDMDLFERGRAYTPQTQAVHKRLGILFGHPPLALTMKTLLRYTEEASHYASHALGMGYILKVMRSKEVKNVFERAYGVEAYRALEATLLQVSAPDKYLERATTAEKYLKSTVVAAALWGNASSVLKQTASITVGASEVGLGNLLSAMGDFLAHPREMVAKVREASPYMRNRVNKLDDNIANTLEQLFATGSERILNRVQWLGYAPIGYFDMVVAGIGFTAAFRKAISDGRTPMEAKAYAEDFVKRTQGSAETLYNPQIKNTFFGRSMTMFMTAAIAQYNFLRHDMAMASKRGIASTVSAVAFDMVVPALICAAITMALTPGGAGDDDDTELEKRIARGRDEFLANLWGGIPMANFVGDAWLTMAASDFSGGRMNRMEYLSPLADAVGSLGRAGKLAYNGQLLAAAINLGNAISIPANMPVIKVAERLAKYAKALHLTDPDEKPWTLREFTREAEKETR